MWPSPRAPGPGPRGPEARGPGARRPRYASSIEGGEWEGGGVPIQVPPALPSSEKRKYLGLRRMTDTVERDMVLFLLNVYWTMFLVLNVVTTCISTNRTRCKCPTQSTRPRIHTPASASRGSTPNCRSRQPCKTTRPNSSPPTRDYHHQTPRLALRCPQFASTPRPGPGDNICRLCHSRPRCVSHQPKLQGA